MQTGRGLDLFSTYFRLTEDLRNASLLLAFVADEASKVH